MSALVLCWRSLSKTFKQDIKDKGNLPVILTQSMADRLVQATSTNDELGSEDWAALSMEFDRLVQQSNGRQNLTFQ